MNIKIVEYDGIEYEFDTDVTWKQVNKWNREKSNPNGYNFKWFYNKTPYGQFILNKLLIDDEKELDVDEDKWYKFIPILKDLFQTYSESWDVSVNIKFLAGSPKHLPREDSYFREYMMIRNGMVDVPTYSELQKMHYKKALMFNNYVLSEEVLNQTISLQRFLDENERNKENKEVTNSMVR